MTRPGPCIPALACIAALLLAGCASKECYDNQNALPLAGFYAYGTGREVAISRLRVSGVGAPSDSLLNAGETSTSQVYLPLRPDVATTSFRFAYGSGDDAPADTLTLEYTARPWFVSDACGVSYRYHIGAVRHTAYAIDSVAVPGMTITNAPGRNVFIYFNTEALSDATP